MLVLAAIEATAVPLAALALGAAAVVATEVVQVPGDDHSLDPADSQPFSFASPAHLALVITLGIWPAALLAGAGVVLVDLLPSQALSAAHLVPTPEESPGRCVATQSTDSTRESPRTSAENGCADSARAPRTRPVSLPLEGPWNRTAVLRSVAKTSKVVVLHLDGPDERFADEVAAFIAEQGFEDLDEPVRRVSVAHDDVVASLRALAAY